MKKEIIKILIIVCALILIGWGIGAWMNQDTLPESNNMESKNLSWQNPPEMQIDTAKDYRAILKTNKGDMEIDLFEKETPVTVNNFVFLARQGFYENVKFHRVVKDFMIQTGDPTGAGSGGPGYQFDDETPITRDYERGIVAMANAGPNTNGSQFFIVHQDTDLPKDYVIFGKLSEGLSTLDAIAGTPTTDNGFGEKSKPAQEIFIKSIEIIEQ